MSSPTRDSVESQSQINQKSKTPRQPRRFKYTSVACFNCQRRKVKCSGEAVCVHCRTRNTQCTYPFESNRDGRRRRKVEANPTTCDIDHGDCTKTDGCLANAAISLELSTLKARFSQLEDKVKRLSEVSNGHSSSYATPPENGFGQLKSSSAKLCIGNDSLEVSGSSPKLSLPAQLSATRTLLGLDNIHSKSINRADGELTITIRLPEASRIRHIIDFCFQKFEIYFPVLDHQYMEKLMTRFLNTTDPQENLFQINPTDRPSAALLYIMLALGESMECRKPASTVRPIGWSYYLEGNKLINETLPQTSNLIDLAIYHLLSSTYLMQAELLRQASNAIWTATHFAIEAKLNDQSSWEDCIQSEQIHRQRVWWSIYWMDRRISQKCGRAYILGDQEIAVEELKVLAKIDDSDILDYQNLQSISHLQSLVDTGRLWGRIWDTFFRPSSNKLNQNAAERDLMDLKILQVNRQLPSDLTWDMALIDDYLKFGDSILQIQRRISVNIRLNLLRMILKQNPLLQTPPTMEESRFCIQLASNTINSINAFMNAFSLFEVRFMAYFFASSLIECAYHLANAMIKSSTQKLIQESFKKILLLLKTLEQEIPIARRALSALSRTPSTIQPIQEEIQEKFGYDYGNSNNGSTLSTGPDIPEVPNSHFESQENVQNNEPMQLDTSINTSNISYKGTYTGPETLQSTCLPTLNFDEGQLPDFLGDGGLGDSIYNNYGFDFFDGLDKITEQGFLEDLQF